MEIIHRVDAHVRKVHKLSPKRLEQWGIEFHLIPISDKHEDWLIHFDIAESNPHWVEVNKLIARFDLNDGYDTFFTDEEIANADWVRLVPTLPHHYAQSGWSWLDVPSSYEDYCRSCGSHVQARPFRIPNELNLGKYHFTSINYGRQFFAKMEVLEAMARRGISGFDSVAVIVHNTDRPSEVVKQIMPAAVAENVLSKRNHLKAEKCRQCGSLKYWQHRRGVMYLNADAIPPDVDISCTGEWFDAGPLTAYREIIANSRFVRLALEAEWIGLRMKPVEIE